MARERDAGSTSGPPFGLQQGTDLLHTVLSLMPDAAIAVDGTGTIVAVNERTEAFFGYPAGELSGKPIEILVPERFRHSHRKPRSCSANAFPRQRLSGFATRSRCLEAATRSSTGTGSPTPTRQLTSSGFAEVGRVMWVHRPKGPTDNTPRFCGGYHWNPGASLSAHLDLPRTSSDAPCLEAMIG